MAKTETIFKMIEDLVTEWARKDKEWKDNAEKKLTKMETDIAEIKQAIIG